jgi:hypothetical protein
MYTVFKICQCIQFQTYAYIYIYSFKQILCTQFPVSKRVLWCKNPSLDFKLKITFKKSNFSTYYLDLIDLYHYTTKHLRYNISFGLVYKSGNACCLSIQKLSSSTLIFKGINIKPQRIIILSVVLYRCKTVSYIQGRTQAEVVRKQEEEEDGVWEARGNRGSGQDYVMRSFLNCTPKQIGKKQWCSWLGHYATRRKIGGSIPDCVIRIVLWDNHSSRTMALGSIKSLTEISTKNLSRRVKAAGG